MATNVPQFTRFRPLPGTGRLGIIAGWFQLSGIGASFATLVAAAKIFFPAALPGKFSTSPWIMLVTSALIAFGCFRTGQLLDERRKAGAALAVLCFGLGLGQFLTGAPSTADLLLDVVPAAVGLVLLASVWKHLE
jgi:hypothetical protein